jgi:A/G-specific adenine glycosylase
MCAQSAPSRDLLALIVETRLAAAPASGKEKEKKKDQNQKGKRVAAFRRTLLRWYDRNRRDLPWRKTRDPYRIWLSEIMLQQTRVAAVLEHYRIFLDRFPNVEALAAASEDAVLAAWSGLGYYRRARSLHQCAKAIVQQASRFPQRAADLKVLPGIGRYTAAAIASIVFGEPVAVVDGNVERVLRRLVNIDPNAIKPGIKLTTAQIWTHAQALLASSRPGDFNQAMMELGATVCVPREPRCQVCPVQKWCSTQKSSQATVERRASPPGKPPTQSRVRQVKKNIWCLLNQRHGSILLVQRPKKSSLMSGMWELPIISKAPHPTPDSALWRTFRHSITVTDYTVHVVRNTILRNTVLRNMALPNMPLRTTSLRHGYAAGKGKWVAADRIPQIPITGLTRKILKAASII